jgi:Peptidase inhibitor I9
VWGGRVGARLTPAQAAAVRQLTGGDVQPDEEGRSAPYAQHGAAGRVPTSYVVILAGGADATNVAARNGVRPTASWKRVFVGFSVRMNDEQLRRLRHDPDVVVVHDNVRMSAD